MIDFIELEKSAMNLPPEDRAILAQKLWESLEGFADPEIEKAWLDEADRRWKEIQDGKVRCIPADTVMKKARAALKHPGYSSSPWLIQAENRDTGN